MILGLAQKRGRAPEDPGASALLFFSLIAAAGFAFGWAAQGFSAF